MSKLGKASGGTGKEEGEVRVIDSGADYFCIRSAAS